MKLTKQLSIYYKLNGIIVGVLIVLSLLLALSMHQLTADLLGRQMEKRGAEVAGYIATLSASDIVLDNHYAIYEQINETKNSTEDLRYILITDYSGRLLAHTFSQGLPDGLPRNLKPSEKFSNGHRYQVVYYQSNEGPIREVIVPIENGDIGYVRVGMSENSIREILNRKIGQFLLVALVGCFAAAILATRLAFVITRPIQNLVNAVKSVKSGDYSVRAEPKTADEVGQLANAFNEMAAGLLEKQVENDQLLAELHHKEIMRSVLINKLFTIQEDERKRISRELHDETGQSISSLLAYMKVLLSRIDDDKQKELVLGARDVILGVLEDMKKLVVELRPPVLDDHGLIAAMEKYIVAFSRQHGIKIHFDAPAERINFSDQLSLTLYRILQESLTNIARHAKAKNVKIMLTLDKDQVVFSIMDDGRGIMPGRLETARKNDHLGIYGMQERAEILGGSFDIQSEVNVGTTVRVILPLQWEVRYGQN